MKKILTSLLIGLALMIVPSIAVIGHINGCTNTGTWNDCCTKTFNITAKPGYRIVDVIVNGVSKGAITSYTFGNLTSAQTLKVITEAIEQMVYTISFNSNGGTGTMEAQTFTEGTTKNLVANTFTRTGYNFSNWNTSSAGTGTSYTNEANYTATEDTTLYAQWTPISYTISYELDGGTATGNPTSYTVESSEITLVNPTKEGYTFTGWTGTGLAEATTTVTIPTGSTGDRTYTANWVVAIIEPNTDTSGANAPVLATGLTPVNWNGTTWVETTAENWKYNYNSVAEATQTNVEGNGDSAWANAQTADGSLYVWIPRYTYKITSGEHSEGNSWNSLDNPGTNKIEVKFSNGTTDDTTDSYIAHPAFTFGTDELQGIWVAKYEMSMENGSGENVITSSSDIGNVALSDSVKMVSKPGVSSWRYISVSNMFDNAYNLNRSLDSHLMKNVEWGAVAYLTNAIGRIPYINNSKDYITGNAGGSQGASGASGTTNAWNTANGVKASTTHNVYGIYDMSGGAYEFVSAYFSGGDSTYLSGDSSGNYAGKLYRTANTSSTAKYVDAYSTTYSSANKGDAVYETSGSDSTGDKTAWDGGYSSTPGSALTVFKRGGYGNGSGCGVFTFYYDYGCSYPSTSFRVVLAPTN